MSFYVNPPADGFRAMRRGGDYVDKTGLIAYTNSVLESKDMLVCSTRPRRFGKSFAAKMLAAYYAAEIDSRSLFDGLKIEKDDSFKEHLNQYNVIFVDITLFVSMVGDVGDTVRDLQRSVIQELRQLYPECLDEDISSLPRAIMRIYEATQRKFYIIIDEWDVLFREAKDNSAVQKEYIQLLRSLFKSVMTPQVIAGAYMTGILPIKKYGTQSALTDFREYTMLEPGPLAEYIGFTQEEVSRLCSEHDMDFSQARRWYDGYSFGETGHIYNPNSIMEAMSFHRFGDYWTRTETYESLRFYIDMNYEGMRDILVDLLGGASCRIDPTAFQNDLTSISSRDDVFTLLVHLGYLAYDIDSREVRIPNEEIREEFIRAIRHGGRKELARAVELSDRLLDATIRRDEQAVAQYIEEAHLSGTAPQHYNDEQALRSVVLMAYLSCVDDYHRFEEVAGGRGYADILFLPNPSSRRPAILIELKRGQSAEAALQQIEEKGYARAAAQHGYHGELLLVGISYSPQSQRHTCRIRSITV